MRDIIRITFAPILALFIIMLGVSFFNTFLSIRISVDGWSHFTTGLVYAAFYAGMMGGAIYMERLIKRTGFIQAFSLFASVIGIAIILQGFTTSPYTWILFRFIMGLGCAGIFVVIESWLLLLSSPTTRGEVLSIYMISLYTAQSLGQFLLNFVDVSTIISFNITMLFCALSITPVCLIKRAPPSLSRSESINIFAVFKKTPLGFFGNLMAGFILSSFYSLVPVYAKETGFEMWQITTIMATTIFGGMALQWPIGYLSDLIERRKVIIITSSALLSLSFILFFFSTIPFYLLLAILFFFGGFSFTLYPLSITYCCDFFTSEKIMAMTCTALIIYGIGCIIGPILSPIVMHLTSPAGVFLFCALASSFLNLFALVTRKIAVKQELSKVEPSTEPTEN